ILESVTGKAEIAVDLVKFQVCLDDRAGAGDPAISAPQCISQLGVCKAATKEINCVHFVSPLILHSLSIRARCMAMVRRAWAAMAIGRAHVCTQATNAHL